MKSFTDRAVILIRSGDGGPGSQSFQIRSRFKKIPEGGNGGRGGDVIFRADDNVFDLERYTYNKKFIAEPGKPGGRNDRTGHNAEALVLKVPCGTTITDRKSNLCIRQLLYSGDEVIAVSGGKGGLGSSHRRDRAQGQPGTEMEVELAFFYVADVALIGYPNSGKSNFLHRVSGSKVKVTDYGYSTKIPFLGSCLTEDYEKIVFCEIPSLAEGSHEGKGIGNKFLRHLKHAKILLYLLDPVSTFEASLLRQYKALREEVFVFDPHYQVKEEFVAVHKADLLSAKEQKKALASLGKNAKPYLISAETGDGMLELLAALSGRLRRLRGTEVAGS